MINLIPISMPFIDWDGYLRTIRSWVGRSPMTGLDESGEAAKDYRSFLVTLHDLCVKEGVSPTEAMHLAVSSLNHLHFTFLIRGDASLILELVERAGVSLSVVSPSGGLKTCVATASLLGWRSAVLAYLSSSTAASVDVRRFYDALVLFFESLGLGELWQGRTKSGLPDKTFLLTKD